MSKVLLVDDEPDFVDTMAEMLVLHGHDVDCAETLESARSQLERSVPDVLLLDLMLPDGNGLELLEEFGDSGLGKVILITGHPGIKSHIRQLGGPQIAYLTKPFGMAELSEAMREVKSVEAAPPARDAGPVLHFGLIVGNDPAMQDVYRKIEKVARTDSAVLVVGETGTGKELVAEAIHRSSGRAGAFVAVNCGSLSRELAGSELFGHEKGSFTGAIRRHSGFFKRAESGTLFLDELTEMPLELQAHFLRVLETGHVQPIGSEQETRVDTRIIAATNRDPTEAMEQNLLRTDLYFRLSVFPILVPPLRERQGDVPLLVRHFISTLSTCDEQRSFSDEALQRLVAYEWPGNVRELKHVVQRACVMTDSEARFLELPERFDSPFGLAQPKRGVQAGRSIRDVERELIELTMEHFDGDKKAAAETLGISLNTLYNRLNSYQRS